MASRNGEEMYTVGLVSAPAPHNTVTHSSSSGTGFPSTYTTTPMDHLDYTLSQISPGLGVSSLLKSPSSCSTKTESKFKDSSTNLANCNSPSTTTSNTSLDTTQTEPVKMMRYESVFPRYTNTMGFINRFGTTHSPSYSRTSTTTSTTSTTTQVYTITPTLTPSSYSPYRSAFTSFSNRGSTLGVPKTSPNLGPTGSNVIKTTLTSYQYPSPSWPTRVKLEPNEGYDNLHFEMEERDHDPSLPPPPEEVKGQFYSSKLGTFERSPQKKGELSITC